MAVNDDAHQALERLTAQIISRLSAIWQRISDDEQNLLSDWAALGREARLARLRTMRNTVHTLMQQADDLAIRYANQGVPAAYELGGTVLAAGLGGGPRWGQPDLDMLGQLSTAVRDDLLAATSGVTQSTKDLVRRLAGEQLTFKAAVGQTAVQAGRELSERLAGAGITAVTYRDGSRHGLDEYAEMAIRAKSAEAYQLGGFAQARAFDVKFMELFDGPGCGLDSHDDPTKANGLILPTEEAAAHPLSHPRCVRVSSPRPDVRTAAQARSAGRSTSPAQDVDQRMVAALRQATAERTAARARTFARTNAGLLTDSPFRAGSVAAMRHARRVARRAG